MLLTIQMNPHIQRPNVIKKRPAKETWRTWARCSKMEDGLRQWTSQCQYYKPHSAQTRTPPPCVRGMSQISGQWGKMLAHLQYENMVMGCNGMLLDALVYSFHELSMFKFKHRRMAVCSAGIYRLYLLLRCLRANDGSVSINHVLLQLVGQNTSKLIEPLRKWWQPVYMSHVLSYYVNRLVDLRVTQGWPNSDLRVTQAKYHKFPLREFQNNDTLWSALHRLHLEVFGNLGKSFRDLDLVTAASHLAIQRHQDDVVFH